MLLAAMVAVSAAARADTCKRSDFEGVVEQAAFALHELNLKNKPLFQSKLADLKQKRGWSHDQFMAEAAPLVQDEQIADFDNKSSAMLDRIQSGGQEGAMARAPDCALLAALQTTLKALIEVQQAKWAYMMQKVDGELAR